MLSLFQVGISLHDGLSVRDRHAVVVSRSIGFAQLSFWAWPSETSSLAKAQGYRSGRRFAAGKILLTKKVSAGGRDGEVL
jgi:hypothetical protein